MANGYIGVDGTARKLKSLYVGVDGVARKVKKAYIGVDVKARLWYQAGTPLGELAVGSIVKLKWNGTARNFIVVQQGKPSSAYDKSCNGTWLLMQGIHETSTWGDFSYSNMNANLSDDILSVTMMPTLPTYNTASSYGSKLFFLGYKEVGFSSSVSYYPQDGAVLSYFSGASNSERIAYYNGTATAWWLREDKNVGYNSASYGTHCYVSAKGADGGFQSPSYGSYGIRPALILPSTVLVDDNNNVIT